MNDVLFLINEGFVDVFGVIICLSFSGIAFKKNIKSHIGLSLLFVLIQSTVYLLYGVIVLERIYPFIIHLPILIIISLFYKVEIPRALLGVLTGYLLHTPRILIGVFASSFFSYNPIVEVAVNVVLTFPILFFVIKYLQPLVIKIYNQNTILLKFLLYLAGLYYIFFYSTTVYTKVMYIHPVLLTTLMLALFVILLYLFFIIISRFVEEKKKFELNEKIAAIELSSAKENINQLRELDRNLSIYRHDFLYQMNYIKSAIELGNYDKALTFVNQSVGNLEKLSPKVYVNDESLNLIISYYISKGEEIGIKFNIKVDKIISRLEMFEISDICRLFSNALDNALEACGGCDDPTINIEIFSSNGKMCIQISNNYIKEPEFENNMPISSKKTPDHGYGTRSIVQIVTKYSGVVQFKSEKNLFILRVVI